MNYKIKQMIKNHFVICQHWQIKKITKFINLQPICEKTCYVWLALYRDLMLNDRLYRLLNYKVLHLRVSLELNWYYFLIL